MNINYKSNVFKIIQVADTQDGAKVSPDTLRLIDTAVKKVKPDLVVYTGDQIWGKSKFRSSKIKVENSLRTLLFPVTKRKIPFSFCFGNHDHQVGVSKEEQFEIYKNIEGCIAESVPNIDGVGNHVIEIKDNDKIVFLIYIFDSQSNLSVGYDNVHENQIEWYKTTRDKYEKETGKVIPSFVFQHIPVPEIFELLKKCKKTEKGAVQGFRTHKNEWFVLNKEKVNSNSFMKESPATPQENSGEFDAFKEKGDVVGAFFGHDHINSFYGKVDNIDLGYTQGAGFHVYGPGLDRGVRVFEIPKNNPRNYTTYDLRYRDICGKKVTEKFNFLILQLAPTNIYDAIQRAIKVFATIGIIAVIALILVFFFG